MDWRECELQDENGNYQCPECGGITFTAKVEENDKRECVVSLKCLGCPEEFVFARDDVESGN